MRMNSGVWASLGLLAASQASMAQPAPVTAPAPSTASASAPIPTGESRPFGFTHLVVKLTPGQAWSSPHAGLFCLAYPKVTWRGGQEEMKAPAYADAFRAEMKVAGFKVDGDTDNIFEKSDSTSDLQVGGIIKDLNLDYCLQGAGLTAAHGRAAMTLEWQVYSSIQKTVLARIETTADFEVKTNDDGGVQALMIGAFKENVRKLIDDPAFRKALASAPVGAGGLATPTRQTPIVLAGALAAGPRPISEAVASVVLIFAGEGEGSGFLVSADGLLLTDRHVVGDARFVKVRWPDGIEGLGEVVRSDKARDVALVKTDPRGRKPLKLRLDPPQPGDGVYAIGSPLGQTFQSSVTRGIVSAIRTFEGMNYIQSDVSVNHGSSGGPLLDEKGAAVGVTEAGFQVGGAPLDINLFTPVGDALDFLSATPK